MQQIHCFLTDQVRSTFFTTSIASPQHNLIEVVEFEAANFERIRRRLYVKQQCVVRCAKNKKKWQH